MKKISVIGLGYVGLVTLCCFSYLGYNVIGTDIDKKKIRQLTKGTCPFYEPELDSLLERGLQNNTINFTEDVGSAVRETDIVFYTKSEAERYCEEHTDEDVEYWFETEKGGVNEK